MKASYAKEVKNPGMATPIAADENKKLSHALIEKEAEIMKLFNRNQRRVFKKLVAQGWARDAAMYHVADRRSFYR